MGAILGDGWVYSYKRKDGYVDDMIILSVKDYDFAEAFVNALGKAFNRFPPSIQPKAKGFYRVTSSNKMFVEWFNSLGYSDLRDIFMSNKEISRGFLRGFFDSEGTHGKYYSKRHLYIKADNTDIELVILVVDLLDYHFGIEANIHDYWTSSQFNPGYWLTRIYIPKQYHNQFLNEIGFSIKRKQEGLDECNNI